MNYRKNTPLIVAPYSKLVPGGIGTWTKNIIDYSESDNRNYNFNILTYGNHLISATNTQIFARLFTGIILYSKLSFQVFFILRKYKPSVLHITSSASFGLLKDLMLIWLSKLMNIPVVMHWHFGRIPSLAFLHNWEWKLLCYIVKESHTSVVIDSKSLNTLKKAGFSNLVNIPNPIGLNLEQKVRTLLTGKNHLKQNRLIFVGHIIRNKGVFELVEACAQFPSVKELSLIGPYESSVKEELIKVSCKRDNGIWLKFYGRLTYDHVLKLMQNSPLLALPSYTEGFPNVVLEAMAMGCAVIATDVGAIPEMLAITYSSPCGVCVPVQDVKKLREAIIDLVNHPLKTGVMGKNGIDRVLNNYTLEKVIEQYKNVWKNAARG